MPNPQKELNNCFNCGASLIFEDPIGAGLFQYGILPQCPNCGADQNKMPGCCEDGAAPERPDVPCE